MSLQQYQEAFAHLIRVPKSNRLKTPEAILAKYKLDKHEKAALLKLAKHRELNKYGREQALQRWEQIERHIGRIFMAVSRAKLQQLWYDDFEPLNAYTEVDNEGRLTYSLGFLSFLQKKLGKTAKAQGLPQYLNDLLRFEIAEVELMAPLCQAVALKPDTALSHGEWRVVDFTFDIAEIAGALEAKIMLGKRGTVPPSKRRNTLLFVRSGARLNPKVFEIDDAFRALLVGELVGGKRVKRWTKEQISGLQAVGLYEVDAALN